MRFHNTIFIHPYAYSGSLTRNPDQEAYFWNMLQLFHCTICCSISISLAHISLVEILHKPFATFLIQSISSLIPNQRVCSIHLWEYLLLQIHYLPCPLVASIPFHTHHKRLCRPQTKFITHPDFPYRSDINMNAKSCTKNHLVQPGENNL